MYRGHYRISLDKEKAAKVIEMLKEKWHAKDIRTNDFPAYLEISFLTDDHKKVYQLQKIIKKYRGKVLKKWIEKVNQ